MSKKEYVCGFFINEFDCRVALIRKTRPMWQCGKLNGIGGKIEVGETPTQAMIREFKEEAGVKVEDWTNTVILDGKDFLVHFFVAFGDVYKCRSMTDEKIEIVYYKSLPTECIANITWLIPISLMKDIEFPIIIKDNVSKE